MKIDALLQQAEKFEEEADALRHRGADALATALETCAEDLRQRVRQWADTKLTLAEAARESGYSRDHLGRMVRKDQIPNAGREGSPRIRRRNLPRKPAEPISTDEVAIEQIDAEQVGSRMQDARSVVESD